MGADLTQVLWDELLTAVHDEHPPHVQLDVILLFLVLKEVKRCTTGDEEQGSEFQLSLDREVLWYDTKEMSEVDKVGFRYNLCLLQMTGTEGLQPKFTECMQSRRQQKPTTHLLYIYI